MTTRRLGNTLQAPRQKQRLQLNIPLGSVRLLLPFFLLLFATCNADASADSNNDNGGTASEAENVKTHLTTRDDVRDLVAHPAFKGFGDLLLPRDDNVSDYGTPLSDVASLMPYHGSVRADEVLDAVNHMIDEVSKGRKVFYDIYTEQQKQQDPAKRNTGLFFFRGNPNAPFAVLCPGGGFSYVGSLHEGFPLAQRISHSGLNAFVLRYRIGSEQNATGDLAASIAYIFQHANALGVSTNDYSLWGGSAGARMVGNIALEGTSAYGGGDLPKPATVILAYTGQRSWSRGCPPAFVTVAANDGIVDVRAVDRRVEDLRRAGVEVDYRRFQSAGHGFGLGTGTDAEGWLDSAVRFWRRHIGAAQEGLIYLWAENNIPTATKHPGNDGPRYFDPPDFRPNMKVFTAADGIRVKGAVLLCSGGAFAFRNNRGEGEPVAKALNQRGYYCFVVNYRVRPYTQQEGALDLARAVRYVRHHARDYGIQEDRIAVAGFSAGGILCGELLLSFKGTVNGTALDSRYQPDELDKVSADASAIGHIYSFYGRLSVASTDVELFRRSNLPPAYFCYGTRDPFVSQFAACANALQKAGVLVESNVLEGWPHGYGARGNWIPDFDRWLIKTFERNRNGNE